MKIETPPREAAATFNVADTPLTTILDLLSGEGGDDPDSVLARLPAEHLDRIATAAQRKGRTAWTWPAAWWTAPPNC